MPDRLLKLDRNGGSGDSLSCADRNGARRLKGDGDGCSRIDDGRGDVDIARVRRVGHRLSDVEQDLIFTPESGSAPRHRYHLRRNSP